MSRIAVVVPSRERPEGLENLLTAIEETAVRPVTVWVGVDIDDPRIEGYRDLFDAWIRRVAPGKVKLHYRIDVRKGLAATCNDLTTLALGQNPKLVAFFGDDHRPRTDGWDEKAFWAMALPGLVYTKDGLQDERLPTAPIWDHTILRALGFYYPPVLKHLFADNYWKRLAEDLGRCWYLDDVLIEHMHPSAGKGEVDQSYEESAQHWEADEAAYARFIEEEHPKLLKRVEEAIR